MKNIKKIKKEIERPVRDYESKSKIIFVSAVIILVSLLGVIIHNVIEKLF